MLHQTFCTQGQGLFEAMNQAQADHAALHRKSLGYPDPASATATPVA